MDKNGIDTPGEPRNPIIEARKMSAGALRSPPDDRDIVFENIVASRHSNEPIPIEFDLRMELPIVRNQGRRDTCAAFSAAYIKEMQEQLSAGDGEALSPEFLYYHRDNKPSPGMYGRNVFQILRNIGVPPERMYPYCESGEPQKPPPRKAYKYASRHRITCYARVDTIDGVKRALIETGPCYLSLPLYTPHIAGKFWQPADDESVVKGGHAVVVVGYTIDGFILRNSWGAEWNGDGHTILPYDEWDVHWECWVSIHHPRDKKAKGCIVM